MIDGQFELDGFLFGCAADVEVVDFAPGARVVVDQDQPVPGADGRVMGRDFDDGPEWTFALNVRGKGAEGLDTLERLRRAWKPPSAAAPGALSVLRYALPGRVRRVYGRPRRFAQAEGAVGQGWHFGLAPALATFQLADPLVYDDEARTLDLGLTQEGAAALTLPATLPWHLGALSGQRAGVVDVGGRAEVPFEVTFHGPSTGSASGFWAEGPGWRVDLAASLAFDQSATVDTRTHTVTRSDGVSLAGAARGRFLAARLRPGVQEVRWGATDPTLTARMTLTWRDGFHSI